MKMIGLLRWFLLVPLVAICAFAQPTGAITGRVQNAATGSALNNARVTVKGTSLVAFTDESGAYRLNEVPVGTTTLRVFFTGLDEKEVAVSVAGGQTAQQDIGLTSKSLYGADSESENGVRRLDPFVVESTRETNASAIAVNEQRFAANITSVVSTDEYGTIPDSNPGEFLKWLPGVGVEYFANNIVGVDVRGLGAANTEINFDGLAVASASTESDSRAFEMQFASAADIARVEVRKIPLPEDSANALGGSINMIRRSAFEAGKRRITYRALFTSDAEKIAFTPRDGPKDRQMSRWQPNWQVQWTEPISKNFGFSLTLGQSGSISMTHWSQPTWSYGSTSQANAAQARLAQGQPLLNTVSIYNPALTRQLLHDAPKMDAPKSYASLRIDWRPRPELTLGYSFSGTDSRNQTADDIRYRWRTEQTGSGDPQYVDQFTTIGRRNGGGIYHDTPLWRDQYAPTMTNTVEGRWKKGAWEIDAKGSLSHSRHKFYDTEHGFFNSTSGSGLSQTGIGSSTAYNIPITITFADQTYFGPKTITATDSAGNPIEWWKNANIRIGGARARPGGAKEITTSGKFSVKRSFAFRNPLSVQLGFDYREQFRNRYYVTDIWRFIGADGVAGSADDSATLIAAERLPAHRDSVYNLPPIERISLSKLYSVYQQHPNWFQYLPNESFRATVNQPYELLEKRLAPYAQFDVRLFSRLRLTGGARFEQTRATGRGLLTDDSLAYRQYSDGTVVHSGDRDASGALIVVGGVPRPGVLPATHSGSPVFLPGVTSGSLAQAQLTMIPKGASKSSSKSKMHPSLHATYNLTENLAFKAAWALTMSQNALNRSVIPQTIINDTIQTDSGALGEIQIRNPNLKPWIGNNYEARLEYYNRNGGFIGVGGFLKTIKNFQVTRTTDPLTAEELVPWGFGPEYEFYEITTMTNEGRARLEGGELELRQRLDPILPKWAHGFLLRGSFQYNNMKGQAGGGDFGNLFDQRHTLHLSFARRKFSANIGYIMNGRRMNDPDVAVAGRPGVRVYVAQHMVDFGIEYSVTRWAKLFVSGRNITNEQRRRENQYAEAPTYSNLNSANNQGSSITLGITGTFGDLPFRMPWDKPKL